MNVLLASLTVPLISLFLAATRAAAAPLVTTDVVHDGTVDIAADLKGAKELFLVVTDADDGFNADWADWLEPTLLKADGSTIPLGALKWKSANVGWGKPHLNLNPAGQEIRVDGKAFSAGIGAHAPSVLAFDLPDGVVGFKARGAVDDGGTRQGSGATVRFQVFTKDPGVTLAQNQPRRRQQTGANVESRYGLQNARANMANIQAAEGLEATLFAAEPMIQNPTNIAVDHRGRVWAIEAVDYRISLHKDWEELRPEGDRVVILEDTNRDGAADKETTFFQSPDLRAPLGICVLPQTRGTQVLVSAAPNLWLLTDADGDDKAEKSEILLKVGGNWDHDHQLHAFTFGPDGKFYFNFGNEMHELKWPDGTPVKDLAGNIVSGAGKPYRQGMALRCDFADGKISNIETLGWNFRNNYEVCVDSFGTMWQSDNDDDGNKGVRINYVMEYGNYGFTDEVTGAGWSAKRTNLEPEIPRRHWHLNDPGVVPNLLQTGQGSPTGILINEGAGLGATFANQLIHCDAGPRIVRAYITAPDGAGYSARIVDVLSSTDPWYRPADVAIAPDGSLFVADWYDAGVGGHNMADRKKGSIMGRIYHVTSSAAASTSPARKVDVSNPAEAVAALRSPNDVVRSIAWQALHKFDAAAETELLKLRGDTNPRLRARAYGLLAQIKGREIRYLTAALSDPEPEVRVFAVRLARTLATSRNVDTTALEANTELMNKLVHDPSPAVRRQIAISLTGSSNSEKLWTALALRYDGKDRWYLEALGIGARGNEEACFDAWRQAAGDRWNTPAGRDIVWRSRAKGAAPLLVSIIEDSSLAEQEKAKYLRAFDFLPDSTERTQALLHLAALGKNSPFVATEALTRLKGVDLGKNPEVKSALDAMLAATRGTARFVELVREFNLSGQAPALLEFIVKDPASAEATEAARTLLLNERAAIEQALRGANARPLIETLGNTADQRAVPLLQPIVTNPQADLTLRKAALKSLAQSQAGIAAMIQLAQDAAFPEELKFTAASALASVQNARFRNEIAKWFPLPPASGGGSIPPMQELLKKQGDAVRGRAVFERAESTCVTCHRDGNTGKDVGPALAEIGSKLGKDALFESVLAPNAGISMGFETTQLSLKNSDVAIGIVRSETPEEITLVMAGGAENKYKKADVAKREKLPTSLMPPGLQAMMSTQDLVDLVEYLASLKKR
jgi:putative membrane-bound dehydrogenase-like protein